MTPNIPGRNRVDLPAPDLPVGNGANDSSDELSQCSSDELDHASNDNSISSLNNVFDEGFISLSSQTSSNIEIREYTSSTTFDAVMSYQEPQDSFTVCMKNMISYSYNIKFTLKGLYKPFSTK